MKKLKHFELGILTNATQEINYKENNKYIHDTSLNDNYKTVITHKSQALKLRQLEKK